MAASNTHYYAARDPLGAEGDFVTAPEISQIFGELVGLALVDLWVRAGSPAPVFLCELGPGRGTLMSDALRAAGQVPGFREAARTHLVETSPALRREQIRRLPDAVHHDRLDTLPASGPLLLVANEFFDALPIAQQVRVGSEWQERRVTERNGDLVFLPEGAEIRETGDAAQTVAAALATRLTAQGGAALVIDYGYAGGETGDTLQAVRAHQKVSPLAFPGEADLTAHVDFAALAEAARRKGAEVSGPVSQAAFLSALGIGLRAERLMAAAPGRSEEISAAVHRLTAPSEMGALFKVLALRAPGWPPIAGVG
ncbi:hypothetical protein B5C34_02585 [Pacificimonas flava]|uniref:Methyltransferase n=3 Tax=Sphingosinicellaceae TaxID=2820280 RepID=A0A219B9V8_9SPHN|nr:MULTISPECIES: SAM-dependent methyltransferase [Pacificimonas]MBZ6377892.1 SAM-dependent methyltransferase [Pacificimonas aurantium]OWV34599.1 hypothetical protein B5C34_02585 [Pacificimonas flava]